MEQNIDHPEIHTYMVNWYTSVSRMYNGERIDSLTNGAEKNRYAHTKRMMLKPHLIPYTKKSTYNGLKT